MSVLALGRTAGSPPGFTFVSWGDTKGGLEVLADQSRSVKAIGPALTIYCGDLVSRFSSAAMTRWKRSLDGGTGSDVSGRTFAVRGNHDKGNLAGWRAFFDFGRTASAIGARNYRALADDVTYSFDYANAHFVGVDVPGNVTLMTPGQIAWMDKDLAAAEQRGLTHAFLFWHGPIYPVGGHCCSASKPEFIAMVNRHPIVSATFHGHEHQIAWVHMDRNRYPEATHDFEEFVTGSSGAATKGCKVDRSDYCRRAAGFATVAVSGNAFTVTFFLDGKTAPAWSRTFTKPTKEEGARGRAAERPFSLPTSSFFLLPFRSFSTSSSGSGTVAASAWTAGSS
jgi:hypothetical protein